MVDRAFAGHGVGRALLGRCEAQIRGQGKQLSRLDCVLINDRLRRYYEQAGYVLVGYESFPEIPWANDVALYEKDLGKEGPAAIADPRRTSLGCAGDRL
jgi:GNAT superfamily N-acetyltransferase